MRCWVNYTTFGRDLEWMRFSLESFKKYATGFSGITIVVPTWDVEKFLQFERYGTPECPVLVKNFLEYPGKGFVHHLAMKCYADVFSPDAHFILHMDPDCLFSAPLTPESYFVGGNPILLVEPYEALRTTHPGRFGWRPVTEMALKFECTHETMCRHPAVHPLRTYRALRSHMEAVHLTPFVDFVLKQKNAYPQGFGEFNTIGAYAMKFLPQAYHIVDRGFEADRNDPPNFVTQLWSYTGAHSKENAAKIKEILC